MVENVGVLSKTGVKTKETNERNTVIHSVPGWTHRPLER